jgi:glycosidase
MMNGPGDEDESKRTPMAWDGTRGAGFTTARQPWRPLAPGHKVANVAAQRKDPRSLLVHYRRLIRARHESKALQRGKLELLAKEGPVLAYLLVAPAERVLVAHNLGAELVEITMQLAGGIEQRALFASEAVTAAAIGGDVVVSLPAGGSGVWRVR